MFNFSLLKNPPPIDDSQSEEIDAAITDCEFALTRTYTYAAF